MLKRRISLATAAAGAALVAVTVAGCGTTAQPIQVNLAASEVLAQTAQKTADVTSYTVDAVVNVNDPNGSSGKAQGRMLYQSKPELAVDLTIDSADFGGQGLPGGARIVLQGDTVYVKVEALNKMLGATKPWVKVPLKEMGDDQGQIDQLLSQVQQFDLGGVTEMVTASQDVKSVGTENVGGEDTTHYAGTFPVDAAVKQLPADKQERARTNLAELKNVKFDIWVGADKLPRKVTMSGSEKGASMDAALMFKGYNEPVSIQAPPADQVGELPKGTTN
ncbi:LppX_LprAFG lipoprotein [Nonomuraea glycinis]|uniref:LppX_LprAFG lipoprotein n=1 Tax=Nonomuraea glycinis TaxID=2047744 RepID=UPI0033B60286